MMNKNIIKKMKINSLFVLCIFVISLFAVPAQAISSYVEDCHWRKATMWGTDVMEVTVHNPSTKTEEFCIECQVIQVCVVPDSTIDKSSWWVTSECKQIGPGETTTIAFMTGATRHMPSFCFVDTDVARCELKKCPACFIATAVYGSPTAKEIDILRDFRDDVLLQNILGRGVVELYYSVSPPLADVISKHDFLRNIVRETIVDPTMWAINETKDYWSG